MSLGICITHGNITSIKPLTYPSLPVFPPTHFIYGDDSGDYDDDDGDVMMIFGKNI